MTVSVIIFCWVDGHIWKERWTYPDAYHAYRLPDKCARCGALKKRLVEKGTAKGKP